MFLALFAYLAAGPRAPRPPRAWLWMPLVVAASGPVVAGVLARGLGRNLRAEYTGMGLLWVLLAVAAVTVIWLVVDARPVIGWLISIVAVPVGTVAGSRFSSPWASLGLVGAWAVAAAVVASPALWRLRRQTTRPRRAPA
jgi:hypothetical protein